MKVWSSFDVPSTQLDRAELGIKAVGLYLASRAQFAIPPFVTISHSQLEQAHQNKLDLGVVYDRLQFSGPFAVRSSSNVEDGASASWAGQFRSVLDVSLQKLPEAVQSVWESRNTTQAKSYLHHTTQHHKTRKASIKMGVVLQQYVQAKMAGVAFTKHPVTNDESVFVVEAVQGSGEKLVAGKVTPSTYVLDQSSGAATLLSKAALLSQQDLAALHQMLTRITKTFKPHQDVEWVIDHHDRLWLLQTRPITT